MAKAATKKRVFKRLSLLALSGVLLSSPLRAQSGSDDVPVGYTTPIPSELLTPDTVQTSIGTFNFFDGMPDPATVRKTFENLKFIRGYETFLTLMPAASIEMLRHGHEQIGADDHTKVVLLSPLNSNPLFLTGNTDTIYGSTFFNLQDTGPMVIEIPAGLGPGTINDAFFRFVADTGAPGPDKGQGGKYLILGPDDAEPSNIEDYFVFRSPTYSNWLILRAFLDSEGKPDQAIANYENGLRLYPFSQKDNPPQMKFIKAGEKIFNTVHANNFEFFNELNTVIQREPIAFLDPELRGLASSIGLEKGKPFSPSPEEKKILEEAIQAGVAYVRSDMGKPRNKDVYFYQGKQWFTPFGGGSYEWLIDGGKGGRNLDARNNFFWGYTVNTPAMVLKMVGVGSQYGVVATDANSVYLDGGNTYKLTIDKDVPAKDFWSMVIYDPQTRSELQTGQLLPSKNSVRNQDIQTNSDGSIDLYFGPNAPAGQEANWIETVPGKGWFAVFRLYGPLQPWFDKTWQLNDIQPLG
ncbi:DUF1254 domain-containing protein [Synechococcus sp. BL107]|uniref:DUF1254 domain-containing protein n=1 Tax=Synechococcus sp. BL107 TaxID=313625 RepID=UPI0002EB1B70|nr:DUF1254 domain-containing protein [Synechococcus sp. BL107]